MLIFFLPESWQPFKSSICAFRWKLISGVTGSTLQFRDALLGYLEATFVNAFLPTLIASDGARVLRAIKSGAAPMNAFMSVITDRLIALCALAVAAASAVFFIPNAKDNYWLLFAMFGILPTFMFGVLLLDFSGRMLVNFSHWRIVRPLLELAYYMRRLRQMPILAFVVITISIFGHAFCAAAFYILGQQLGINVSYYAMFAITAPILVYAAVPISVGGWGIREAVTATLFSLVGVDASVAVALSIAFGLLMSLVGLACGASALSFSLLNRIHRAPNSRASSMNPPPNLPLKETSALQSKQD